MPLIKVTLCGKARLSLIESRPNYKASKQDFWMQRQTRL